MKRYLLLASLVPISTLTLAGTETIITQSPSGEILEVEKVERPPPDAFMSFEEADLNGDGRVDRAEARNAGILGFDKVDTNGDGFLDRPEYEAAGSTPDMPVTR